MSICKKSIGFYLVIMTFIGLVDFLWINPANKTYAKSYLDESIALSAGTYAICRIINGGVSSIQESSISISPWGIGIEYEAGQVLDPINDATERLSDACVKSMALLGIQRLLLTAVNTYTIVPFYLFLFAFFLALSVTKSLAGSSLFLARGAVLLLLVRISTPMLCYMGTEINKNYFAPRIEVQQEALSEVKAIALAEFEREVPTTLTTKTQEAEGAFEIVTQFFMDFRDRMVALSSAIRHRTTSLTAAMGYMKNNFDEISKSLALLFVLVIEKVALQVFLLPLGLYFLLRRVYGYFCGEHFRGVIADANNARANQEAPTA